YARPIGRVPISHLTAFWRGDLCGRLGERVFDLAEGTVCPDSCVEGLRRPRRLVPQSAADRLDAHAGVNRALPKRRAERLEVEPHAGQSLEFRLQLPKHCSRPRSRVSSDTTIRNESLARL